MPATVSTATRTGKLHSEFGLRIEEGGRGNRQSARSSLAPHATMTAEEVESVKAPWDVSAIGQAVGFAFPKGACALCLDS